MKEKRTKSLFHDANFPTNQDTFRRVRIPALYSRKLRRSDSATFAEPYAVSVSIDITDPFSISVTIAFADTASRRAEFSPMGIDHCFQRTSLRQRPCDRSNTGWGDVVWDRQRPRTI